MLEFGAVDLDDRSGSPNRTSAAASTTRVLPEPVGPRKAYRADRARRVIHREIWI
ncbi:MAG: hypothetical protein IPJ30_23830 [Acidobacteria bacterium]|nr:hypothetical protein [Acidobacteriota bacterium]